VSVDLSDEMAALADRLGPPPPGGARALQFLAARSGEGTSTVARAFADALSRRPGAKGVWLIELDLLSGAQGEAVATDPDSYGALGAPVRASPDQSVFFDVQPQTVGADGRAWPPAGYLAAYPLGGRRFWVTRFRVDALRPGQQVRVTDAPDYWRVMRAHADWIVVDAPAAERSRAALAVAPHMDATVLVVDAEGDDPAATALVRDQIQAAGGRCLGAVLNRAPKPPPGFLRRFGG
jgi:hypothetical protein